MESTVNCFIQSGQDKKSLSRWYLSRDQKEVYLKDLSLKENWINGNVLRGEVFGKLKGKQRGQFRAGWAREKAGRFRVEYREIQITTGFYHLLGVMI